MPHDSHPGHADHRQSEEISWADQSISLLIANAETYWFGVATWSNCNQKISNNNMCAVVLHPCHPLVLFWWTTLHSRIASQFGVYWPNGRALPIVLMTATNWPASWINHWIVQGKCSVVASKCRRNVSFSIVDGNSLSQMKWCSKCMVSQWGWNCPQGLLHLKLCSPCWSGFHQSWRDTSMPPCHFVYVKKR